MNSTLSSALSNSLLRRWLALRHRLPLWSGNLAITSIVGLSLLALRFAGLLQLWELALFDVLVRARPQLPPDSRIVIVGFDEADLEQLGGWPISDGQLAQLLALIKAQEPKMIGLDIYRDLPVDEDYPALAQVMESTPNLIGIQRVINNLNILGTSDRSGVAPPPILAEKGQVGANDFPQDLDGRVRRGLLYLQSPEGQTVFGFAFKLAWGYLAEQGIEPKMIDDTTGEFSLGSAVFLPLESWAGGYVRADTRGFQLLINYRSGPNSHQQVSLAQVLSGEVDPDIFHDRIVIIGSTAPSLKDFELTPYSNPLRLQRGRYGLPWFHYTRQPIAMTGVELHANLTSFLIDTALGERSLLRSLPEQGEWLLISLSIVVGTTLIARWRTIGDLDHLLLFQTITVWLLGFIVWLGVAYIAFLGGWWLPLVPSLLGLSAAAALKVGATLLNRLLRSYQQIEDYARTLELKVEERTEQLRQQNQTLEQTLEQLQTAQEQIIAQERLASLGSLTAGVAHEIRNPLNFVNNFAHIAVELGSELAEEIGTLSIADQSKAVLEDIFLDFQDCMGNIAQNGQRIERIVESMLSHTQADAGEPIATDLNALLQEAWDLVTYTLQTQYPNFEIEVRADYDESLPPTQVVPQMVSKALMNMLTNAWEAMARRAQTAPDDYQPRLQLTTQATAQQITLAIQDNGEGIAPEIRNQIFDPFFTTKPTGEGTGLGLSLAHQALVAGHQGAIAVDSKPNHSTQFTITLPIVAQDISLEDDSGQGRSPQRASSGPSAHIFEVEMESDKATAPSEQLADIPTSQVFEIETDIDWPPAHTQEQAEVQPHSVSDVPTSQVFEIETDMDWPPTQAKEQVEAQPTPVADLATSQVFEIETDTDWPATQTNKQIENTQPTPANGNPTSQVFEIETEIDPSSSQAKETQDLLSEAVNGAPTSQVFEIESDDPEPVDSTSVPPQNI
ncbi:MAG: CHASE2 domain-containing protein [Spirulina sp. SIO3F2]|nr:CHASE2 domain-containing protein [Spirulina sp. SIO3F2]